MSTQSEAPTPAEAYRAAMRELETLSMTIRTPGVTIIQENADLALRIAEQYISVGDSLLGMQALAQQGDL